MSNKSEFLCNNAAVVNWLVRKVQRGALASDIVCNGVEYLLLGERAIIRDVVNISWGIFRVGGQQKTLYCIGNVTKWQSIVSTSNNHATACLHSLGDTTIVEAVVWTKDGAGTQNHRFNITGEHQSSHQAVTLCLAYAIGIVIWSQGSILGQETTMA